MPVHRVVVTGIGSVTPLGVGHRVFWKRLVAGNAGISALPRDEYHDIPSRVAGKVPLESLAKGGWDPKEWFDSTDIRRMAPFTQYAVAAAQEAIDDAHLSELSQKQRDNVGVIIGSGIGSLSDITTTSQTYTTSGYRRVSPLFIPRLLINLAAGHISMRHRFRGPSLAPSTACTTGAHAIGDAYNLLRHCISGTTVVVAGATEAAIDPVSMAGFCRARSLSVNYNDKPAKASRPFDRARDGFVMGEGAGVLVLETLQHAQARGAGIYAEVVGYGMASDAHHITAPDPEGTGAYLAMQRCLADANVEADQIDWVNAHATGTVLGDRAENKAIRKLIVEQGGKEAKNVNVSSIKGAIGHLLGASGAVEAIASVLSVKKDSIPPTVNLENIERNEHDDWDMNYVPLLKKDQIVKYSLSNSFGFGGTCASLCFKKFID